MRMLSLFAVLCAVATLSGCGDNAAAPGPDPAGPPEDCATPGDEDGNGLADCADPACAGTVACQPVCGNGKREAGEGCDDGNAIDGDGCDANCTVTACGNGVMTAGEACDDGNATNGDGCDDNCTVTACGNGVVTAGEACDDGNATNGDGCDDNCTVTACGNGIMTAGEVCDDGNANDGDGCDHDCTLSTFTYIKASNTGSFDHFGFSIALSADGSTLAVSATTEDSSATGVGGNQASDGTVDAGAVYVYVRTGATWMQQAYIKASNTGPQAMFGTQVALSADGSTLAVGAPGEASAATGINGNQADSSAPGAGAVYVFTRTETTWTQQAYVKASNTDAGDAFGLRVAVSADGATLAVGANHESSAATGINGDQSDNAAMFAGAAYVFTRTGTAWTQQAYLKGSNTARGDELGRELAISGDGATLVVGAAGKASSIPDDQTGDFVPAAGTAYVFTRTGTAWTQQASLESPYPRGQGLFSDALALSFDGTTLAISTKTEPSAATGIDGDETDRSAINAGAVYVFTRSGAAWNQQAYIKASNTDPGDGFGWSVALSNDGSTLAVGATVESSAATGVNGNQASNDAFSAGAVYEFARSGTAWHQTTYVKAPNTDALDLFGYSVALSGDGMTLAVSSKEEGSGATGIGGDEGNAVLAAGATYVFH